MSNPLMIIEVIFLIIGALMGVVFLSILERSVLGISQIRKGPNKNMFMGVFQSVLDAMKLFLKEQMSLFKMSNVYFLFPMGMVTVALLVWLVYPMMWEMQSIELGILFFIGVLSVEAYFLLFMSWISNNKYSMLGSLRSVSQMVSYEVVMFLGLLGLVVLMLSFNFYWIFISQSMGVVNLYMLFFYLIIIFFCLVSEMNRSPMDLVEAESELVSGFNIEFMSYGLSLIFISEFSSIMIVMLVFSVLMMGLNVLFIIGSLMSIFVLFIRVCYPRYRYDLIMKICWKILLPLVLGYFYLFYIL